MSFKLHQLLYQLCGNLITSHNFLLRGYISPKSHCCQKSSLTRFMLLTDAALRCSEGDELVPEMDS